MYLFCRNDERRVPIIYESCDNGESWSKPLTHNIPFLSSKIYSGTLSDGRNYVVGNLDVERKTLAIFFSEPGEFVFTKAFLLQDGMSETIGNGIETWQYPCAYEADGNLYVLYSAGKKVDNVFKRGAVISVIPLDF